MTEAQDILRLLDESFYKGFWLSHRDTYMDEDTYIEVFKNPGRSEVLRLIKQYGYLRFILSDDGLFVFNGEVLHHQVQDEVPVGNALFGQIHYQDGSLDVLVQADGNWDEDEQREQEASFNSRPEISCLRATVDFGDYS